MFSPGRLLSQRSLPVAASRATKLGDCGEGMLMWLSSTPFPVVAYRIAVHHERRADREVVREDVELRHHVVLPHHVPVARPLRLLVGHRSRVAVLQPLGVEGDEGRAVRGVVEAIPLDERRRADPLLRPVVHPAGGELLVGHLPQEVAVGGGERHDHSAIVGERRVADGVVVRAHEDLAARHRRAGIGLGAHVGPPLHVASGLHVPVGREPLLVGDHVAREGVAEHGPIDRVRRPREEGGAAAEEGQDERGCERLAGHSFPFTEKSS